MSNEPPKPKAMGRLARIAGYLGTMLLTSFLLEVVRVHGVIFLVAYGLCFVIAFRFWYDRETL